MHRLIQFVRHRRLDLVRLNTHTFSLDEIVDAYKQFSGCLNRRIEVGIKT